jgi:hypothetical protein
MAAGMAGRGYKRSWKNLILDTEYQLVFTIAMVLSAVVFMSGLGYEVFDMADTTTKTAIADVQGQPLLEPALAEATIAKLSQRRDLLKGIVVGAGFCIAAGLFIYGIKMTHRVAGPLYKVSLYCDKVTAGSYEEVRNLRKGDQLVSFYEHFRQAYATLRHRQETDVACLRALIASADEAKLAERSPELAERLGDLRTLLANKEAGLV